MLQDNLRNKMCPDLLASESGPKNDDNFFPQPQERSQSSCPLLWGVGGRVETSDFKDLLEAQEKSGTVGRVGFMVNGEGRVEGLASFWHSEGLAHCRE